jgi:phosphopantothenoylcysteine decarboxylase/phosphopantothenate--cysteine ligase
MEQATPFLWGREHVVTEIAGVEESDITGYRIVLGVTASAAMYKALDLARKLIRMGATVRVFMTPEAAKLISPTMFEWATGYPVTVELTGQVEHVSIARSYDALLIAPATLNTLADIASGHADNALTALAQEMLGQGKPVLAVPAMHGGMWRRFESKLRHQLEAEGVYILEPELEGGRAKLPPVENIAWWVESTLTRRMDLRGLRVLVTAGPTWEFIDPVRIITNPSSGLMGVSLALEAAYRGAQVTIIHGPLSTCISLHGVKRRIEARTSDSMAEIVIDELKEGYDVAVYAAAVADFKPERTASEKIPSRVEALELRLVPTRKIVREAVEHSPTTVHIAFAAETVSSREELERKAVSKLAEYKVDAVVANNVAEPGIGFGSLYNEVLIVTRQGWKKWVPRLPKRMVARRVLDVARSLRAGR